MEVQWLEQTAADVSADDAWLSTAERLLCGSMKLAKRRNDWSLGRWTAKHAVANYLGLALAPEALASIEIRPAASGAPEVFLNDQPAEVSISLSHSDGTAACAVAPAGAVTGCDLERIEPRSEAFIADYFTAEEQAMIAQAAPAERDRLVTVLWSAKESALKALRTGLRLDTRRVSVWLASPSQGSESWSALTVRYADQLFQGWWRSSGGLARTMVSVPAAGPPIRQA